MEIKLSTRWDTGEYRFRQLRDQAYTHLLLFGVAPDQLRVWCVPKQVAWAHAVGQHAGAAGTETRWLGFRADAEPAWLRGYGGAVADGLDAIQTAIRSATAPIS